MTILVEFLIDAIERVYRCDHCVQNRISQLTTVLREHQSPFMYSYKQAEKASHASRVYSFLRTRQSLKIDDIDLCTTYSK